MTMPRGVSWRDSSLWTRRFSRQRGWGLLLKLTGFAQISITRGLTWGLLHHHASRPQTGLLTNLPNPYEAVISIADPIWPDWESSTVHQPRTHELQSWAPGSKSSRARPGRTSEAFGGGLLVSAEPSVSVPLGRWSLALSGRSRSIALVSRALRTKSRQPRLGIYQHGDVIYPNFSIICGNFQAVVTDLRMAGMFRAAGSRDRQWLPPQLTKSGQALGEIGHRSQEWWPVAPIRYLLEITPTKARARSLTSRAAQSYIARNVADSLRTQSSSQTNSCAPPPSTPNLSRRIGASVSAECHYHTRSCMSGHRFCFLTRTAVDEKSIPGCLL